ncbi:carboxylate-amine ligase [Micromonospora carbonacea]|uniref:Putative glutamate--cysteine ligase 2 n=1 Tax=Micromonospora carbonacea TaxID=47853 RepID=A0A7H8XQC7_9ACTN|nr:glutamate--cysteine ligase [Micromonospora carbonacea]MBB5826571.1 carboxylate-amine ligase [Micromonospora carbonacea]QLD26072.1 glutamate--cysteine ligase [Micromonospora carbonacea]
MSSTTRRYPAPPRFGVEEEFLVVDAVTRAPVPRAAEVVAAASTSLGERVSGEITTLQLETRTHACGTLGELTDQLGEARKVVADCARAAGLRVVATGTAPVAGAVPPPMTVGPRQTRGAETFRGLHDELALCALHVHVELPDRDRAVLVGNHLRPYLPLLLTLTANSPYWDGRDSGYASWRTTVWGRWPVAGPPPVFDSAAHYDEVVGRLLDAGALVDRATIFWDVRPSERHPTLEVRVADSALTAEDAARYAALVRALVAHLTAAVDAGEPAPHVAGELLRVAYWRAARDGLAGAGLDPRTGRLRPAAELARELLATVEPALRAHGDHDAVARWLEQLDADGTGARRQRAVVRAGGTLADVVDRLAEWTAG